MSLRVSLRMTDLTALAPEKYEVEEGAVAASDTKRYAAIEPAAVIQTAEASLYSKLKEGKEGRRKAIDCRFSEMRSLKIGGAFSPQNQRVRAPRALPWAGRGRAVGAAERVLGRIQGGTDRWDGMGRAVSASEGLQAYSVTARATSGQLLWYSQSIHF